MAKPISLEVDGITVSFDLEDGPNPGQATLDFKAPPGVAGSTRTVNLNDSTVVITSVDTEGCHYRLSPSCEWKDVSDKEDIDLTRICGVSP